MDAKELNEFADRMIAVGRAHGFILGMKRSIEILRKHGVPADHAARLQLFTEMMDCDQDGVTRYMQGALNANKPVVEEKQ